MQKRLKCAAHSVLTSCLFVFAPCSVAEAFAVPPRPIVTRATPNIGLVSGGGLAIIYGANFSSRASVSFGGRSATVIRSASTSTQLLVKVPRGVRTGLVNVRVSNSSRSFGILRNGYKYARSLVPLSANAGANVQAYTNELIFMTAAASGGFPPYSYYWKLPDGSAKSDQVAYMRYAEPGSYLAYLTVTDSSGATAAATVTHFISLALSPPPLTPTRTPTPTPTGEPTGTLTALPTATPTRTSTPAATPTPGPSPLANAGTNQSAHEGAVVSFSGSASGGTPPLSYSWNFGDGTPDATGSLSAAHRYVDNGSYTATLTVSDAEGRSSQDTALATANNVAPMVSVDGPYSGTVGQAILTTRAGATSDSVPVSRTMCKTSSSKTWIL